MNIAIVGGGMSGCVCAILLARKGHKVTIIERNNRLGRKISMSGNGRCNIFNNDVTNNSYCDSKIMQLVSNTVTTEDCYEFLHSVGIVTYADSQGRVYPITDNANSVVDCLRYHLQLCNVTVMLDSTVTSITNKGKSYTIKFGDSTMSYDQVVLAVGSGSGTQPVNLSQLVGQDNITPLIPSLVPIVTNNAHKVLNGIRAKVNATLCYDDTVVAQSNGEVLFKDYGLSGICIMQLSCHIARGLKAGNAIDKYSIELDLLPSVSSDSLLHIIQQRLGNMPKDKLLLGLLHNKLAEVILKDITTLTPAKVVDAIKRNIHCVSKLLSFDMSQVTVGGISQDKLNDNLQLNGIYAMGECLDVDGNCGGYNLRFAIMSAIYVADAIG